MASAGLVVSASWLKRALQASQRNLVLLDTTWVPQASSLPKVTGQELYKSKRIPGALHFELAKGVTPTKLIPRNLPEPTIFQKYARSLGIGQRSHVVFYDRDDGALITAAASRSCFIFKLYGHDAVSILNGGLVNWEAEGYDIETTPPSTPPAGDFLVNFRKDMIVDFDAMRKIEAEGDIQIVDMREPIHFNGQEPEPCLIIKIVLEDSKCPIPEENEFAQGHMPKAINLCFLDFFEEDKVSFKSKEDLKKLFKDAGVDLSRPAVTTCYIGHTASMCQLLASYCGQDNFRLYYGSWTEYGQLTA